MTKLYKKQKYPHFLSSVQQQNNIKNTLPPIEALEAG
jgi:hypothetical protein